MEVLLTKSEAKQGLNMQDRKLLIAILILIGLVAWLIVLSLNRSADISANKQQIELLKQQVRIAKDGYSPIKGVDYFDGQNAISTNTIIQVPLAGVPGVQGIQGVKGDKGDKGDTPIIPKTMYKCINGLINTKYDSDLLWQESNIVCEAKHE